MLISFHPHFTFPSHSPLSLSPSPDTTPPSPQSLPPSFADAENRGQNRGQKTVPISSVLRPPSTVLRLVSRSASNRDEVRGKFFPVIRKKASQNPAITLAKGNGNERGRRKTEDGRSKKDDRPPPSALRPPSTVHGPQLLRSTPQMLQFSHDH
jgi:hypothetical protein